MEYFVNSKMEKQTIYDIYRACRLCGGGAGYKMPIIQTVVNIDAGDIELKQKIRECVQIEVHQDDKMPPLICELCVDKVNDFYEFLEMCRQTNKRTRLRLGLPPQTMPKGAPDAGDCILGVTEPVFINRDSNDSPSIKSKSPKPSKTKESDVKSKTVNKHGKRESKELKSLGLDSGSESPGELTPLRLRGTKRSSDEDSQSLSKLQRTRSDGPKPKSILKKNFQDDEDSLLVPRHKRFRDRDTKEEKEADSRKDDTKKVKISLPPSPKLVPKVMLKTMKLEPYIHKCKNCKSTFKSTQALASHMRAFHRTAKPPERRPSPPPKRRSPPPKRKPSPPPKRKMSPPPKPEVKNEQCMDCKKSFLNRDLLRLHTCTKAKKNACKKCKRTFPTQNSLKQHEGGCGVKKEFVVSPRLMRYVKPIQIRVAKCDSLLEPDETRCDVSGVSVMFGLDESKVYPYLFSRSSRKELRTKDSMVKISDEITNEFNLDDTTAWESDDSMDMDMSSILNETNPTTVERLSRLALRAVYQARFLQKKKMREMREKPLDSMLKSSNNEIRHGIDSIIKSLDDDEEAQKKADDSPSIKSHELNTSKSDSKDESVTDETESDGNEKKTNDVSEVVETENIANISDTNINANESEIGKDTDQSENNDIRKENNDISNDKVEDNDKVEENNDRVLESDDKLEDMKDSDGSAIDMSSSNKNLNGIKIDKHNNDLENLSEMEMDDRKLMEAIDAQIGESETKNVINSASEQEILEV